MNSTPKTNIQEPTKFKKIKVINWKPDFKTRKICPKCKNIIKRDEFKFVSKCSNCGAVYDFFNPTPFQAIVLREKARFVLVAGGYGSGKTTVDAKKIQQHVLSIPGAHVACFSQMKDQLIEAFKNETLSKFFLDEWILIQNQYFWQLKNGSKISFFASDDEGKIRSYNFSMALIMEASKPGLKPIYEQLKARLRHPKAVIYKTDEDGNIMTTIGEWGEIEPIIEKDFSQVLVETNPTDAWPKSDMLFKSSVVYYTENIRGVQSYKEVCRPHEGIGANALVSIMSATIDNPSLTRAYKEGLISGKQQWQIDSIMYGDFSDKNRLIFGELIKHKVEPFAIPYHWPRYVMADPGIKDKFAILWVAIDPKNKIAYIYDEFYKSNQVLRQVVEAINTQEARTNTIPSNVEVRLIDNKSGSRQHALNEFSTVRGLFEEFGLEFDLAKKSSDKKADIIALQSLIDTGQIKYFSSCTNLDWELNRYTWQMSKDGTEFEEKPPTKDDHLIDCLRYFGMEVPLNFNDIRFTTSDYLYANSNNNTHINSIFNVKNKNKKQNKAIIYTK